MNKKTILITGSTDGIGKQTALELAERGHRIIVHGRNAERAINTVEFIKAKSGKDDVHLIDSDLSSLENVRKMADRVKSNIGKIDILINNAGVYMNEKIMTIDGFETTLAVNHLAPFLLTNLLLPVIPDQGRIINVSSVAHNRAQLDWDNINSEIHFDSYQAYALSKLANVLFTFELADRLKSRRITVNALHPGVISTKLLFTGFNIQGASLKEGSETSVYLATSEKVSEITGKYFVRKEIVSSSTLSCDRKTRNKFWQISGEMTKFSN